MISQELLVVQHYRLNSPHDENTTPAKKLSNNGENVENPTPSSPKSTHMSTSSNISTPQNCNTVRKQLGDISNITCTPIRPKHHDTLNDSGILLSTPEIEIETNSLNRKNKSNSTVTCSKELFKDTPINVECHDHIYSAVSTPRKRLKIKSTKETLPKEEETLAVKSLKKIIVKQQQYDNLSPVELAEIVSVLPLGSRSALIQTLLKYDSFKHLITDELMKILSNQHDILKNRKRGKLSVLNGKSFEDMINFNWSQIVEELCDEFPVLCRTILSFMLPDNLTEKTKSDRITSMVPRIGFIYSLLAQSRNQELSKVQHMINTILFDNLCDQKVFDRLHSIGACMSYGHSLTILDKYGGHFNSAVIDALKSGKRIRLVGDNINWMTNVHDERKDNHAHMHHAFGSACIIQNTSFDLLSSIKPQLDYRYASVETFLPSRNDWHLLREDYSVHILKVASKHIPFFKEFCKPFENFFHGTLTEELKTKNKVIPLPVLHYNEQKYDEVVKILDFYESFLRESFGKANIDYNDTVKVLIGGDQLTRERFSGSKCLRAGGITADERFDHLSPITFELFHLCMNYVKLIMKQLFKDQSVNEMGTMKYAYITEAVMTFFEMENPTSAPTINRHEPPSQFTNDSEKKEWILSIFGDLVDKMVWCNESDTCRSYSEEEVHEDGEVLRLKLANGNFKSFVIKKENTTKGGQSPILWTSSS
ncbi:unnamed protein product [Mytilus edulis]|uniref:DUF6589 domain-containing protein n=1 Tax=Mytilus edulis TaxID=6550 RepID=A0A8S3V0M9_MYTED|nr:unnamed protein product [Mytilus edulis]